MMQDDLNVFSNDVKRQKDDPIFESPNLARVNYAKKYIDYLINYSKILENAMNGMIEEKEKMYTNNQYLRKKNLEIKLHIYKSDILPIVVQATEVEDMMHSISQHAVITSKKEFDKVKRQFGEVE